MNNQGGNIHKRSWEAREFLRPQAKRQCLATVERDQDLLNIAPPQGANGPAILREEDGLIPDQNRQAFLSASGGSFHEEMYGTSYMTYPHDVEMTLENRNVLYDAPVEYAAAVINSFPSAKRISVDSVFAMGDEETEDCIDIVEDILKFEDEYFENDSMPVLNVIRIPAGDFNEQPDALYYEDVSANDFGTFVIDPNTGDGLGYVRAPPFLTTEQYDFLFDQMDHRTVISALTHKPFTIWTFKSTPVELAYLNHPVNFRPGRDIREASVWTDFLVGYFEGRYVPIDEDALKLLSRHGGEPYYSLFLNLMFYGTELIHFFTSGLMTRGLRGGAKEEEVDDIPRPKNRELKNEQPIVDSDNHSKLYGRKKKRPTHRRPLSEVTCYLCKEKGHTNNMCPKKKACEKCGKSTHDTSKCKGKAAEKNQSGSRSGKRANLTVNSLVQSLQEEQGKADAAKEIAREAQEQLREAVEEKKDEKTGDEALTIVKYEEPKTHGMITFRTNSKIFVDKKVRIVPSTAVAAICAGLKWYYDTCKWFLSRDIEPPKQIRFVEGIYDGPSLDLGTPAVKKQSWWSRMPRYTNYLQAQYTQFEKYSLPTKLLHWFLGAAQTEVISIPKRLGGVVHTITNTSRPAETADVRLDYLAVGNVKHEDPLYSAYSIKSYKVRKSFWRNAISKVLPIGVEFTEVETENRVLKTEVSREAFINLASFRISPFQRDDSAIGAVKIALTRLASINHSKHFVEDNSNLRGMSDEALTRTFEAIMAFREHLKEEQYLRFYQVSSLMDNKAWKNVSPVFLTDDFKARSLNH